MAGETVNITAVVENIGGSEGTYAVMLTMDGVTVEAKEVAITPGGSKVVTFSLAEEIPGTYEIAIGGLTSTLTVEEKLVAKEFELKYDDGTTDWSQAIGGPGRGHIVQFSPPYTPFTITTVKIFGKLYGTGYENLTFDVQIWDSEQEEIHSASYPHTEFSLQPAWVEIDIPDVTVSGDFYIHVFTNSLKEDGISIHSDSSVVNEHSEVTLYWEIVDWYLSSPKEEVNWMIRANGTAMLPATTVPEPTPEEVELKYDAGEIKLSTAQGPGWGYSVHFSPPATPFTISQIKVLVRLYGTEYADRVASLEIWDENFDVLYSREMPATEFSPEGDWVTVETNITIDGDFRVVFFTNSGGQEGGISIGYDLSGNKASEVVRDDGTIADWPPQMEAAKPKDKTNWMIRVVGTSADETTTATSSEFQETISSLDSPQKLSQWMIENIKGESYYEREKESGTRYTPTPQETFEARSGNCRVFAVFACYILQYHGYEAEILGIKVESDERMNHVVCVYRSDGSLYVMNNGRMEGPYQNYEDIAFAHHEGWSSYEIHYSWESYQQLKRPDEIVHR